MDTLPLIQQRLPETRVACFRARARNHSCTCLRRDAAKAYHPRSYVLGPLAHMQPADGIERREQ
jgi:hypothetical protein